MIIFEWLNSLSPWQQAIIGIPYAIIIGFIIMLVMKEIKIEKIYK